MIQYKYLTYYQLYVVNQTIAEKAKETQEGYILWIQKHFLN